MTARFVINLRRESMRRQAASARRRTLLLAAWLSCLGALVLLIGFYGLNWMSLVHRARQLERRTVELRASREHGGSWEGGPTEVAELERYAANARAWRDRLERVAQLVPSGVRITTLALDPNNVATTDPRPLVLTGEARGTPGQDRLRQVMEMVTTMRRDSAFAADYPNVRIASTRFQSAQGARTEFVIECR